MKTFSVVTAPADVFYVVQSMGLIGEQQHSVSSVLYETRIQAEAELTRLRAGKADLSYSIWRSTSYVEPHQWLYPVVLADGSIVSLNRRSQQTPVPH